MNKDKEDLKTAAMKVLKTPDFWLPVVHSIGLGIALGLISLIILAAMNGNQIQ